MSGTPRSTRRRAVLTAAALATALLATAACGSDEPESGNASTIKIGMLVPTTGTYVSNGADMKDGFELYLKTHGNKLGGHNIDLIIADEGDGAPTALPAAQKLIKQDKVQVLTGGVGGGSVAAIQPLINEEKIPFVGSNARPQIANIERVWTTSFMSSDAGKAIAEYVKNTVGTGTVFAIGPDYQGGYDQVGGFTTEFLKLGGKLANPGGEKATWTPFPTTTNFTSYFSQIKASGAKAVYTFYAGKAAIDFVKQYSQSEIKDIPLYAAGFLTDGTPMLQAQGDAAKNVWNVLNYSVDLDNATNREFVSKWNESFPDRYPTYQSVASYDAAAILDRAIAAAGDNPTPESINKAIGELGQITSPRGNWQFGPKTHAPVQLWYLRQVRNDGRALTNVVVSELATVGE